MLLQCSFSICFSYEKFHKEIVLVKEIFIKNEFSQFFIGKLVKNYLSKSFFPKRIICNVDKKQVLIILSFLGPLSFEVRFPYHKNVLKTNPLLFIEGGILAQK